MRRKFLAVGIGMLFITALSSFVIARKKSLLIVFIGDSITQGAFSSSPETEAPPARTVEVLRHLPGTKQVQFSNQGVSGFTTVDFLPSTNTVFNKVVQAAADLSRDHKGGSLLFSIMLGTNDSAIEGPNGSPVSAKAYRENMKTIVDRLLQIYPDARVVLHHPLWYSPSTYNGARYLQEGLDRLQSYFPAIDGLIAGYAVSDPGHVFAGDQAGFDYFKENYRTDLVTEHGHQGDFFLHPNQKGAAALGRLWAAAIHEVVAPK